MGAEGTFWVKRTDGSSMREITRRMFGQMDSFTAYVYSKQTETAGNTGSFHRLPRWPAEKNGTG